MAKHRLLLGSLLLCAACGPSGGGLSDGGGGGGAADAATTSVDECGTALDQVGCPCEVPDAVRDCYSGSPDTRDVGSCADGTQVCVAAGGETPTANGFWGSCTGDVLPTGEDCADAEDEDCNGAGGCSDTGCATEPGCQPACFDGETRPCYTGPIETSGVGACHPGTQACTDLGQWESTCDGEVTPEGNELFDCDDGIDNDCDGTQDCEDFECLFDSGCAPEVCSAGETRPCYDGPAGTDGVASCHGGTQTCAPDGESWGDCEGQVLPGAEGGHCTDGLDNDCDGETDCDDVNCASAPSCCVDGGAVDGTIYAHSSTDLYVVNPSGWVVTHIGDFDNGDSITDLAVTPDGNLYGVSFSALYRINKTTGEATYVADLSGSSNNGLTFLDDGRLLASDSGGWVKRINPTTGAVTDLGNFDSGLSSSGDLVAVADGTMFGVSSTSAGGGDASGNNVLLRVNPADGHATVVGPIGFGQVWGVAYVDGQVIGFTTLGQIIEIDPVTGAGTLLASRSVAWWGAGMSPLVPPSVCP